MTSDHSLLCASIFIIYNCPSHIWYCEANKYFIIPRQNCITYILFAVNEFDLRKYSLCAILDTLYISRVLPYRFGPYFVEPVIAGLDPKTFEPYVCSMDLIGCINEPEDFVVAGTCTEQLYGVCEALWEPDLEPDDLFEIISQALTNALDRDPISGWGAVVHVM
jgi:hypothetical protein